MASTSATTTSAAPYITYISGGGSGRGGGGGSVSSEEAVLLGLVVVALSVIGVIAYLMYEKPCLLKKHLPSLHKWIFKTSQSDIKWPGSPKGCEE